MMKKIKLSIEGMHCASCATNVERSLKSVKGVDSVVVNVITKKGFVEAAEHVSDDELKKAVERVGYKVKAVEH